MSGSLSELVLVRHGETTGQSSIRLYGATDIGLSDIGERQARAAGEALRGRIFDRVVTSPLVRARRSAELVLEPNARPLATRPPLTRVEQFREIDFGDWEGWTVDEVAARDPEGHRRWREEGETFTFPNGEQRARFLARVREGVQASIAQVCAGAPTRILGVLHKGVIKIVISELTGMPYDQAAALTVNLGSIHRLESRDGVWTLLEQNRVDHLDPALYQPHS